MINTDNNISMFGDLVDWSLLEQRLGHHFETETSPPCRLMIGLIYLKTMNNLSYQETFEKWENSPQWQRFCGVVQTEKKPSIRASSISIWDREIGDDGLYWMRVALAQTPQSNSIH